jgi:hypothetical protein
MLYLDKRGRLVTKRNKYGVAPKEERMVDGIVFASKREATRYRELKLMQKFGDITELTRQPRYTFPMGFAYLADFRYREHAVVGGIGNYDRVVVEDVKGVETEVFRLKRKCMAYFFPDVELRIIR